MTRVVLPLPAAAPQRTVWVALAILVAILVAGCGGDSTGPNPTPAPPVALAFITAPATSAAVASVLNPAPVVELRDSLDRPVKKQGVSLGVSLDGGSVGGATSVATDASGRATFTSLSLSGPTGPHLLKFASAGITTLSRSISLTTGAATQVSAQSAAAQSAPAGTAVADPPSVLVSDGAGNPVAGVSVLFAVTSGGGTVVGGTVVTSAAGTAAATSWTLGTTPGANSLTASVAGATAPAVFSATGTATANLTKLVDNLTGEVGQATSAAPSVKVTDVNGVPLEGVTVTFATTSGSIADAMQLTDVGGVATAGAWTLGTTAGSPGCHGVDTGWGQRGFQRHRRARTRHDARDRGRQQPERGHLASGSGQSQNPGPGSVRQRHSGRQRAVPGDAWRGDSLDFHRCA